MLAGAPFNLLHETLRVIEEFDYSDLSKDLKNQVIKSMDEIHRNNDDSPIGSLSLRTIAKVTSHSKGSPKERGFNVLWNYYSIEDKKPQVIDAMRIVLDDIQLKRSQINEILEYLSEQIQNEIADKTKSLFYSYAFVSIPYLNLASKKVANNFIELLGKFFTTDLMSITQRSEALRGFNMLIKKRDDLDYKRVVRMLSGLVDRLTEEEIDDRMLIDFPPEVLLSEAIKTLVLLKYENMDKLYELSIKLSLHDNEDVQTTALENLLELSKCSEDYRAIASHRMFHMTFDSNWKVRGKALSTLCEIPKIMSTDLEHSIFHRIRELADDYSPFVRQSVAYSIGELFSKSESLTEKIRGKLTEDLSFLSDDISRRVRSQARKARSKK